MNVYKSDPNGQGVILLGHTSLKLNFFPGKVDYWMPVFTFGKLLKVVKFKLLHSVEGFEFNSHPNSLKQNYFLVILDEGDVKHLPGWVSATEEMKYDQKTISKRTLSLRSRQKSTRSA